MSLGDIIGLVVGTALLLPYLYTKNWILNNIFATIIVITMIKTVRMPNFLIGSSFLIAAFAYDIFWVFYSERYFGHSVMEYVATQVDLPMKLVFPIMKNYIIKNQCSLIGLGDLALPGFFISFTNKFDKQIKLNLIRETSYFKRAMQGYICGLSLCAFFLIVFSQAQPALLYLTPCVILPVFYEAIKQKQFKLIVSGMKEFESILPTKKNIFDKKQKNDDEEAQTFF